MARTVRIERMGIQKETSDKFYVVWSFPSTATSAPSSGGGSTSIKVGSIVTVKSGAKWYNGATIASFVFGKQWKVVSVSGDRVVLGKSTDGAYNIMSPIKSSNLNVVTKDGKEVSVQNENGGVETVDHYEIKWWYDSGNADWFEDGSETTGHLSVVHTIPSNATRMRFAITPVAKTYKKKVGNTEQEVPYWNGSPVIRDYNVLESKPETLAAPTVTIDKFKLTARYENITDPRADCIEFEVYKTGLNDYEFTNRCNIGKTYVVQARAEYIANIEPGYKYSVRARAVNLISTGESYGEWSPFSGEESTIPGAPTGVRVEAETKTSVKVSWDAVETATEYVVEYTTNKKYFDSSSQTQSVTVKNTTAYITGLEAGKEWYFRVAAKNEKGESGYSDIVYKIIGTKPEPPTTWMLTSTAVVGEDVILFWTHNTEDGSKQNQAQIELTINGIADIITVDTSDDFNNEDVTADKVYSYKIPVDKYSDGAKILWRIRTRGITYEYSDWSVQRTIDVYAPAVISVILGDATGILSEFPYTITAHAGPSNQNALSYHISITAMSDYETLNQNGERVQVSAGTEIFSKIVVTKENTLSYYLEPSEIVLENNQSYTVSVTVSMNSGLTAVDNQIFLVSWSDTSYDTDASVYLDTERLCSYITPHAYDVNGDMPPTAILSIYRREPDGTLTEIATDIPNDGVTSATDLYPSLDYARYRIIARESNTGSISYSDLPNIKFGEPSIVIQWDEDWSNFDLSNNPEAFKPAVVGSMLRLPYNVDTSENYDLDTSLVEYIGRKNPVSYYGTQRGVSATWNTDIPKYDKETIYALRRLAAWNGDVYVREPNGNGYRANVKVSWSIKHGEVKIPVSINVNKVEEK